MTHATLARAIALATGMIGTAAAAQAETTGPVPLDRLGTVSFLGEEAQAMMPPAAGAKAGDAVTLLLPIPETGSVLLLRGVLGVAQPDEPDPSGEGRIVHSLTTGNDPAATDSAAFSGQVGFALPDPLPPVSVTRGTLEMDLNVDGAQDRLETCLTVEGVRLSVKGGAEQAEIWSGYVPLHYDVEANCE